MNQRQGTKNPAGRSKANRRARLVAAALAVYAIAVPVVLSVILAAGIAASLPPPAIPLALAIVMLGPGVAVIVMLLRGLDTVFRDITEFHDQEPQQIVIHALFHGIAFAYIAGAALLGLAPDRVLPLLAVSLLGVLCGWLLFIHLIVQPEPSSARRGAAMIADIAFISVYLHIGDRLAAPWVSMYLWCSLGFGAYFGLRWLTAGSALSLLSFAGIFATTPFWRERPETAASVATALLLLPVCTAQLVRRLSAARAMAEEAKAAKSRFLAIVSQELRIPVSELIGSVAALARTALESEQRSLVKKLQSSARLLLSQVNDILDFANIEAGKLRWDVESFSLHEVLGGTVAQLRPQAEAKGLALSLRIDPRLPPAYLGLPHPLRHIATSLIGNAIAQTPRGRIDVSARLTERAAGTVRLRLAVRDDGIGVAYRAPHANAVDGLFDITVEAEGAVTRRHGGLGLAVARHLTELMGGAFGVESELGKGSTFTVDLALPPDPAGADRVPDLAGRDLLVVTADRDLATQLQGWLGGWGGGAKWFADGDSAMRHAAGSGRDGRRGILLIDGRDDLLAGLSLAHRLTLGTARRVLFISPPSGGDSIAGLGAGPLAGVVEAPVSESALANALLVILAGDPREADMDEPLPPATVEPPAVVAAAPPAAPFVANRPLRVLIAEDSDIDRKILKRIIELAGHEVTVVDDGEAALAILDRERFDLALLDIDMPEMGGREVTKLFRMEHLGEARLPIVALAAEVTDEIERQCHDAGMDSIVTKPMEPMQLLAAIDETYGRVAGAGTGGPAMASPSVTPISSHPRFFSDAGAVVDEATIDALRMLGGSSDFLRDIIESFCNDGRRLLQRLREAAAEGDLHAFKELTHSLRSGAANVGAARLCQTLATLKDVTAKDLRLHGSGYVDKLQGEFTKLEGALDRMAAESRSG